MSDRETNGPDTFLERDAQHRWRSTDHASRLHLECEIEQIVTSISEVDDRIRSKSQKLGSVVENTSIPELPSGATSRLTGRTTVKALVESARKVPVSCLLSPTANQLQSEIGLISRRHTLAIKRCKKYDYSRLHCNFVRINAPYPYQALSARSQTSLPSAYLGASSGLLTREPANATTNTSNPPAVIQHCPKTRISGYSPSQGNLSNHEIN